MEHYAYSLNVRTMAVLGALLLPVSAHASEIDGIDSHAAVAGPAFETASSYAFMNLVSVRSRRCLNFDIYVPFVNVQASDGTAITCTETLGAPVIGSGTCSLLGTRLSYPIYAQEVSRPAFASGGWAFVTVNAGTDAAPAYRIYASQHTGGSTCSGWGTWSQIAAPALPAGDGLTAPSAVTVGTTTYVFVGDSGANGYGGIYYASNASGGWPTSSSGWSTTPSVRAGLLENTLVGVPVATYSGNEIHVLELGSAASHFVFYDSASIAPDGSLAFGAPDPNFIWHMFPFAPAVDPSGENGPAQKILSACTLRDDNPSGSSPALDVVCQDLNGRYYSQKLASLLASRQSTSPWPTIGGPMPNAPPSPAFNPLAPTSTLATGLLQHAVLLANSTSDTSTAYGLYVAEEMPVLLPFRGFIWSSFASPLSF